MNKEWTFSEASGSSAPLPAVIRRPAFLAVATILFLIVGVLGAFGGFINLVSIVFVEKIEQFVLEKDSDGEMTSIGRINQANYGVIKRLRIPGVIFGVAQIVASVYLSFAAYRAFRLYPNSLLTVCYVLIAFELLRAAWAIFMSMETSQAISMTIAELKQHPAGGDGPGHANAKSVMAIMRFSQVAGMIMWGAWALLKLAFYGVVATYLRKENIRQLFTASSV